MCIRDSLLGGHIAVLRQVGNGTGDIITLVFDGEQHGAVDTTLDAAGGCVGDIEMCIRDSGKQ